MNNQDLRILCMVDLSGAPEVLEELKRVARVDYLPSDKKVLLENIHKYDAFWGHTELKIDKTVLDTAKKLKVINTASTGTDHIDKKEAAKRGIDVLSITRDYGLLDSFTATAECAWVLAMASLRHLRSASKHVLEGKWQGQQFVGRQLFDLTYGVLGVGRLGKMTCRFAKAFCKRTIGCDLKPFDVEGVQRVSFDELLAQSDVISIHIHMLDRNYHLFNKSVFDRMKDGSVLINTSRGDIIDEAALIDALDSGKLSAFGADVVSNEWREDMRESPLIQYAQTHENVLITPHIGGVTEFSLWGAREFSARKLTHYLETGKALCMPEIGLEVSKDVDRIEK